MAVQITIQGETVLDVDVDGPTDKAERRASPSETRRTHVPERGF